MNSGLVKAEIVLFQPNLAPTRVTLDQPLMSLGRAAECSVPIKDRFLSRRHAELLWSGSGWNVRDCGSANGTFLNGNKIQAETPIHAGDRIALGDSEVVFQGEESFGETMFSVQDSQSSSSLAIPFQKAVADDLEKQSEASKMISSLALELIEDRPLNELFDFILDRVMKLMKPSRAALAILTEDKKAFQSVRMRCREGDEAGDLAISRTLLAEVVEGKKLVSFDVGDTGMSEKLGQAMSIIGQSIRSALCAPLIAADSVLGVLYVDSLITQQHVSEEYLRLLAQIARFAAVKVETTRLREQAYAKGKIEEELRTAYVIQSRLLPASPPIIDGYTFAGVNKPARTVSGDYYDFVIKPDGRLYFVIADVSGKGITAALVMASLATAFTIHTRTDPTPAELLREINITLSPKLSPSKFVTIFAGILEPTTGKLHYANGGHVPPLWVRAGEEVTQLDVTDMVIGLFPAATYRDQSITLDEGDSVVLFTDGITEAENAEELELGHPAVCEMVKSYHCRPAARIISDLEASVREYAGAVPLGDDVTLLALSRN